MSNKIESTVILKCKADKIEEFKTAVSEFVSETVKESGCELFKILQNRDKSDEFTLWEIFTNQESLDIHMKSLHTQKIFALGLFEMVTKINQLEVQKTTL